MANCRGSFMASSLEACVAVPVGVDKYSPANLGKAAWCASALRGRGRED